MSLVASCDTNVMAGMSESHLSRSVVLPSKTLQTLSK